ncbi:MAG TPA: ATP-binding cassette domain-containing protein [Thermoanaerobaculia bacterium]|nr:ATP-binding cassette domain-containing protein [Thermoanaerobaculia bacterium]
MIEAQNLTRRYGDFTAVQDVSFSLAAGEIVGMLGPNGAGKTTTLRMITGFLPPTSGRVTVAGKDLLDAPHAARRQLGYLPEKVALYNEMRVEEYLAYRARLEGLGRAEAREGIENAIERCLLVDVRRQIIGTLSKGFQQRVGLATAILHQPSVLVLDEPTVGLDPKQIIAIRELIRELGRERTLLLSTHILPEVELLCNRVMIIDRGRIVAEGTPESLRETQVGNPAVRILLKDAPAGAGEALGAVPGVISARAGATDGAWIVEHQKGTDLREAIFHEAVERGWVLLEMIRERASLEDIFVRLTTHDAAAGAAGSGAETPAPLETPETPAGPAEEEAS